MLYARNKVAGRFLDRSKGADVASFGGEKGQLDGGR